MALDDGASLAIPEGAFSSPTSLQFGRISGSEVDDGPVEEFDFEGHGFPRPPDGMERVSAVYDFDAGDYGLFSRPVALTLPYAEGLIPEGASESEVVAVTEESGNWIVIFGLVDTEANTLTFVLLAPGRRVQLLIRRSSILDSTRRPYSAFSIY